MTIDNLVLGSLTLIAVTWAIVFAVIGCAAINKERARWIELLLEDGLLLRMSAVFLIVVAVVYLALAGKLETGPVGILSGIAGYVLGGVSASIKTTKKPAEERPAAETPA